MAQARDKLNKDAATIGNKRLLSHMIFTPGQPDWLDKLDAGLALKPDSCKGYTIGDNTHKDTSRYPWRMDDEKVAYKGYEKMVAAGIKNVCIHKGLFAPGVEKEFPRLRGFADVADVGQAAKDWPQLNFIIYHSAYRHVGGDPKVALAEFERTGRISWTSDLADIPQQYGVSNVYGDVGQLFATTLVAEPNVCAALMGTLIKGLGTDHVCWGTDALWTGSPQWQIEGLRRLEIPEAMQKKYGFAALGPADGPVKTAIFGSNNAKLYGINSKKAMLDFKGDKVTALKAEYEKAGSAAPTYATATSCQTNRWITPCLRKSIDTLVKTLSAPSCASGGVSLQCTTQKTDYVHCATDVSAISCRDRRRLGEKILHCVPEQVSVVAEISGMWGPRQDYELAIAIRELAEEVE